MTSKDEVSKIAKLARIEITEEQSVKYAQDLSKILGHMEILNKVELAEISPMTHVHGAKNVFRDDVVQLSLSVADVLMNAPDVNGQFFRVPIIKEHGSDN